MANRLTRVFCPKVDGWFGRLARIRFSVGLLITLCLGPTQALANTIVEFDTSLGNVDVSLFDSVTPLTVANFLSYVNTGAYTNTIVHRSVPGFVIQGGGYDTNENMIPTHAPVMNEPFISNTRGTLAMARIGGLPNSGTDQWFFNLVDNPFLDTDSGGWTVFGTVISGMPVIDAIAGLTTYMFNPPFDTLPLRNYSNFPNPPTTDNLVVVNSIQVIPEPSTSVLATIALATCIFYFRCLRLKLT